MAAQGRAGEKRTVQSAMDGKAPGFSRDRMRKVIDTVSDSTGQPDFQKKKKIIIMTYHCPVLA